MPSNGQEETKASTSIKKHPYYKDASPSFSTEESKRIKDIHRGYEIFSRGFSKMCPKLKPDSSTTLSVVDYAALGLEVYNKFDPVEVHKEGEQFKIPADIGGGLFSTYEQLKTKAVEYLKDKENEYNNYTNVLPGYNFYAVFDSYLIARNIVSRETINKPGGLYSACHDNGVYSGNGSNELYTIAVRWISQDLNKIIVGKDVFLVQSPSYAFFADPIVLNGCDVETIPALEKNEFKLTPDQLQEKINATNDKLFHKHIDSVCERYPAYLREITDLGVDIEQLPQFIGFKKKSFTREEFIKNRQEIIEAIKAQCTDPEHLAKIPEPPRPAQVSTLLFYNPYVPLGQYYTQAEINELDKIRRQHGLYVIEDRAHEDLNIGPAAIGSFGNVPGQSPERLFILTTPSKILGVADLRLGAMCVFTKEPPGLSSGRISMYRTATAILGTIGYFKTQLLKVAYYDCKERAAFVDGVVKKYRWRHSLALQLVGGRELLAEGLKKYQPVTLGGETASSSGESKSVVSTLNEYELYIQNEMKEHSELAQRVMNGLPGVRVLRVPEFAFYLMLDFSEYQGCYLGTKQLMTGLDFQMAIYYVSNINTISEMLYTEKPVLRFSLAIYEDDIVEVFARFHKFVSCLQTKPLPEILAEFPPVVSAVKPLAIHHPLVKQLSASPKSQSVSPELRVSKVDKYKEKDVTHSLFFSGIATAFGCVAFNLLQKTLFNSPRP